MKSFGGKRVEEMRIHQLIELFSAHYHGRAHLSPFFRYKDYYVSMNDQYETVVVHLCKRSCNVVPPDQVFEDEVIRISGSNTAFRTLLNGEARLSHLIKNQEIHTTAPYRLQLKLESIFRLASEQSRDAG